MDNEDDARGNYILDYVKLLYLGYGKRRNADVQKLTCCALAFYLLKK